jgi:O-antigen/teichoic acid export membrane protein
MTARLSRNTFTLLISNIGGAGLSFLLSVLIGRAMGKDGLGIYSVVLAWVFPLNLLVEFGLGTLATRDVAQDTSTGGNYLRAMAAARLWLGVPVAALVILAAPLISSDPAVILGLRISAPMVIILPFFSAFTAIFKADGAMWPVAWLNIAMLVTQVVWTALAFRSGGGLISALIINVLTSAGQLAAAWGVYRWNFHKTVVGAQRAAPLQVWPLVRRAWPFALAALFAAIQTRLSVIMLEQLSNAGTAGYYAAASRFVEAARMFPNAFFGALFPALSLLALQPALMNRTFRRATLALAGFGLLAGLVCWVAAPLVIRLTYGPEFTDAVPVLQILMWSLLPGLLRGGRTLYWYALGRERWVNWVNGFVVALQLALSVWLIPLYGALGVALVMVLIETAALVLLWREIRLPALDFVNRRERKEREGVKTMEDSLRP